MNSSAQAVSHPLKENRAFGFAVIIATYILASAIGVLIFCLMDTANIYMRVLVADIAATIFVYLVGLCFSNASVYDPYWSVQPIVILAGLMVFYQRVDLGIVLLGVAIVFWGVRLTANWVRTFKNLTTQDWRYDDFKQKMPRLYPLISLVGIHMFPTLVVYLAMLPAMAMFSSNSVNLVTFLGFFICLVAVFLELIADCQMAQFRKTRTDRDALIRVGLWKNSRHPNYLGEIMMWWGVFIMMASRCPGDWFFSIGAVVNTLMFLVVSIPMAEARNSTKPGYAQYRAETRALLPLRRRPAGPTPSANAA